ncbi:MAG: DnaB-like helicase C-terminal domain-containing protein [Gallionella sp.]|nr:DnaB-like helicase C-terminal domain-containing protein [Gallionella sp.]
MNELLPRLEKIRDTNGATPSPVGLSSGFKDLDERIDGFHPGELIVVAARPSMGKRQFVWQIALHIACELNKPVAYFSTGTSRTFLLRNMTGYAAQLDLHKMWQNELDEQEWQSFTEAAQKIAKSPLIINDSSADPCVIRKEAEWLCESDHAPGLIVVDNIPDRGNTDSAIGRHFSNMSEDIFRIARDNGIPVIALAGASRDVEHRKDKHVMLSDVASADGLEWYADTVISLYRDAVYDPDTEDKDQTRVEILKSFYGRGGSFELFWRDCRQYQDYDQYHASQAES